MNTIHWKRITALLLVLVLGIGLLASARADRDELYEDDNEMDRAHWGMAATMQIPVRRERRTSANAADWNAARNGQLDGYNPYTGTMPVAAGSYGSFGGYGY